MSAPAPRGPNREVVIVGVSSVDLASTIPIGAFSFNSGLDGALMVGITDESGNQAGTSGNPIYAITSLTTKTIKTITGTISATTTIIAAVSSKRIKVTRVKLFATSQTAVTVTFKNGANGTALDTDPLQALTGTNFGYVENVGSPNFLFGTSAGNLLEMAFSGAVSVTYNISYFDDDSA